MAILCPLKNQFKIFATGVMTVQDKSGVKLYACMRVNKHLDIVDLHKQFTNSSSFLNTQVIVYSNYNKNKNKRIIYCPALMVNIILFWVQLVQFECFYIFPGLFAFDAIYFNN